MRDPVPPPGADVSATRPGPIAREAGAAAGPTAADASAGPTAPGGAARFTEPDAAAHSIAPELRAGAAPGPNAPGAAARFTEPDAAALDELRQMARDGYARGDLSEAIDLQCKLLAAGPPVSGDALFLALMLFTARELPAGIALLRDSLTHFPDDPALHENLAVFLLASNEPAASAAACRQALALGSASPNVHDCLCDALNQLGEVDDAVRAGRAALEAKDRMFGARQPVIRVPAGPPPAFDPDRPGENVIAYCLWGNEPRYLVPLLESVRILPHLFPAWSIRVYYDTTVDHNYMMALAKRGVQLRQMILPPGQPAHRRLLWRFEAIRDPSVKRFLIRDADALLNVKERVAVDAWLLSDRYFHAMRDWYTHTDLILAGMWGGVGNVLPSPTELFRASTGWRIENDHIDQDILSDTVWPAIRHSVLIHDSIFTGTLGSVPFPPFGRLPAGSHIGQNAFAHFNPANVTQAQGTQASGTQVSATQARGTQAHGTRT